MPLFAYALTLCARCGKTIPTSVLRVEGSGWFVCRTPTAAPEPRVDGRTDGSVLAALIMIDGSVLACVAYRLQPAVCIPLASEARYWQGVAAAAALLLLRRLALPDAE